MAYEPKKDIEMAAKRHKAQEIVTKLRQVDVLNAQGKLMAEAIRSIGVTEVTYYSIDAGIEFQRLPPMGLRICRTALSHRADCISAAHLRSHAIG
jgi:hypothetical protein